MNRSTSRRRTRPPIERWFVRRGVPHFITNYSASEDVFTRALPALVVLFLLNSTNAIYSDLKVWEMVWTAGEGLVVLLVVWALLNRMRGRPLMSRPERVGALELTVFVVVPAAPPLLYGGRWLDAALTLLFQSVLLVVVYAITSYGLVAIAIWATGRLFKTLGQTFRLFIRSLPLLLDDQFQGVSVVVGDK